MRKGQFEKGNEYSFKPKGEVRLDSKPLTVRLRLGQLAKLKTIPDWQERLRDLIAIVIEEAKSTTSE